MEGQAMRPTPRLIAFAIVMLMLAGCGGEDRQTFDQSDQQAAIASLENELDRIDRRLEQMQDEVGNASQEVRQELQETYADLKAERVRVRERITALENAGQDQWRQMHPEVKASLDDLAQRVDRARETVTGGP